MRDSANASDVSDEQLAAAITQSWQTAHALYGQLYDRHAPRLLAFLRTRARPSQVEDVHQEVWKRVWNALPTGFRGGNFRAWLFEVARNYLVDLGRRQRHAPAELHPDAPLPADDRQLPPDALLMEEERQAQLRRCLGRLDPAAAELVKARLAGEAYEAICRRIGLKPNQAYKVFHEAKEQLRQCLERDSS